MMFRPAVIAVAMLLTVATVAACVRVTTCRCILAEVDMPIFFTLSLDMTK